MAKHQIRSTDYFLFLQSKRENSPILNTEFPAGTEFLNIRCR